jgi:hypothetical protein
VTIVSIEKLQVADLRGYIRWGSAAEAAESPAIPSHLSRLSHCVN